MLEKKNFSDFFSSKVRFFKKMMKKIGLLPPNSRFKIFWETIMVLMIFINFFLITAEISFDANILKEPFLYYFSILFFIVDIIINFNSSYYENGIIVVKRKKIINNYIRKGFSLDVLALIGLLFIFFESKQIKIFSLIFLLQLISIKKRYEIIEEVIYFGELYELLLVVIKIVCVAHLFACMWHACSYYQDRGNITWITNMGLENSNWMERYLYSVYWALTTMVTVGYGDISPQNKIETVFCIFTFLIGTMVFGYSLNCIGGLLTKMDEKDKELKYILLSSKYNITYLFCIFDFFPNYVNTIYDVKSYYFF